MALGGPREGQSKRLGPLVCVCLEHGNLYKKAKEQSALRWAPGYEADNGVDMDFYPTGATFILQCIWGMCIVIMQRVHREVYLLDSD